MTDAEQIGELYGRALARFDSLGEFELALSNAMSSRHYDWDADELARVLQWFIDADVASNPPNHNEAYRELRAQYLEDSYE